MMDVTKSKIISMLKENTGRSLCDSGDAYGRHWEKNQTKNFDKTPEIEYEFYIDGNNELCCDVTKSIYHHLTENLVYDEEMDKKWIDFVNLPENEDKYWLELMEMFIPDGFTINTYNGECLLSQTIQYRAGNDEGKMLLQIHNGCDIRGGYTTPVFFYIESDMFHNYADCGIFCPKHGPLWDSYDAGYSFDDTCTDKIKKFKEYEVVEVKKKPKQLIIQKHENLFGEEQDMIIRNYKYQNKLAFYDKKIYCPLCGTELEVI